MEHNKSYKEALFFCSWIPLSIQDDIEKVENYMWEHVKDLKLEDLKEEVFKWVLDPGSTARWPSTYDQIMATFWVMQGLLWNVLIVGIIILNAYTR